MENLSVSHNRKTAENIRNVRPFPQTFFTFLVLGQKTGGAGSQHLRNNKIKGIIGTL